MPRHVEAWMDGVALSSVGPVLIQQVYEDAPTMELTSSGRAGRYGQLLMDHQRSELKITIEVVILELRDLAYRATMVEQLAAWAGGSTLELSHHPDRQLSVVCTRAPTLGTVRDYTSAVRMEFTAFAVPYWEDRAGNSLSLSGTSAKGVLPVSGSAETPVCISVTPSGGTLTSFTALAADRRIALTGLSVPRNSVLTFGRDHRDDLVILAGGVSQLSHRSADSDDDLMVGHGSAAVSYTANTACSVRFTTRGRWT